MLKTRASGIVAVFFAAVTALGAAKPIAEEAITQVKSGMRAAQELVQDGTVESRWKSGPVVQWVATKLGL